MRTGKTLTALETARLCKAKKVLFLTKKKAIESIKSDYNDFYFPYETYNAIPIHDAEHVGSRFVRLDGLHRQWHGYTFNPHIARRDDWVQLGGFSQFRKERHISRALRTKGKFVAYLRPGACRHIGGGQSVTTPHLSTAQRLKAWLRELQQNFLLPSS